MPDPPRADLDRAWERVEELYREEPRPLRLRPPADERGIARCEDALRLRFPPQLRALHLRHDGGELPDGFWLCSLDEVVRRWTDLGALHDGVGHGADDEGDAEGRIRPGVLHAGWIPLAERDGTTVFVDCAPGPRGRVGQVIVNHTECDHLVLADGPADLLAYVGDLLQAGRTVDDEVYGFFVDRDRRRLREDLAAAASARGRSTPRGHLGLLQRVVSRDAVGVRAWIASGRDLDAQDRSGRTALLHAVAAGDRDLCDLLIDAGADVDRAGGDGGPLMAAAHHGDIEVARSLLRAGADPDARDRHGQTALHLAAGTGPPEIVAMLLEAGADVDAVDTLWRTTALMRAARRGRPSVVDILLSRGAAVDAVAAEGTTALMDAAGAFDAGPGHLQVVTALLAAGAGTAVANWEGTAVDHARKRGNHAVVDVLEAAGRAGAPRQRPGGRRPPS